MGQTKQQQQKNTSSLSMANLHKFPVTQHRVEHMFLFLGLVAASASVIAFGLSFYSLIHRK